MSRYFKAPFNNFHNNIQIQQTSKLKRGHQGQVYLVFKSHVVEQEMSVRRVFVYSTHAIPARVLFIKKLQKEIYYIMQEISLDGRVFVYN